MPPKKISIQELQNSCFSKKHPSYSPSLATYGEREIEKFLQDTSFPKSDLNYFMLLAASQNKFALASVFIKAGADILTVGDNNNTMLMLAAIYNNVDFTNKILKNSPNKKYLNQQNNMGETAFYLACLQGASAVAETLLKNTNCDPKITTYKQVTPLYAACSCEKNDTKKLVEILLKKLSDGDITQLKNGIPCIYTAIWSKQFGSALLLLERIQNSNWINTENDGSNSLDLAFSFGDIPTTRALINQGAVFSRKFKEDSVNKDFLRLFALMDERNETSKTYSLEEIEDVIRFPSETLLRGKFILAVFNDDIALFKKCLRQKPTNDTFLNNLRNKSFNNAFLVACSTNRKEYLDLILQDPRFDITATDADGNNGLKIACMNDANEIVKALFDSGKVARSYSQLIAMHTLVKERHGTKGKTFDFLDNLVYPPIKEPVPLAFAPDPIYIPTTLGTPIDFPTIEFHGVPKQSVPSLIKWFESTRFKTLSSEQQVHYIYKTLKCMIEPHHLPLVECLLTQLKAIPSTTKNRANLSETLVLACQYDSKALIECLLKAKHEIEIDVNHVVTFEGSQFTALDVADMFNRKDITSLLLAHLAHGAKFVHDKHGLLDTFYSSPTSSKNESDSFAPPMVRRQSCTF